MASDYQYSDPRLLFELWRELTGEDLLSDITESKDPQGKSVEGDKKEIRASQKETQKKEDKMR